MIKIDWNNKKIITIIEYIFWILILGIVFIISNRIISYNTADSAVLYEISEINTQKVQDRASIGNFKVEVLEQSQLSYYIRVNCKKQTVAVYIMDEDGEYNIQIKNMICSTGDATPNSGVFEISDRYEWRYLVGNVYGQYATRITGQILFHSVPYTNKDKSTLEYWEYDKLGQPVSKGCVRLKVEDAKWIYDNCKSGTKVEFCSDEDNSENDKYTNSMKEIKLSDYNDELRGWDPTDPDENNPWLKIK